VVDEPESLAVATQVNIEEKIVSLDLSGSDLYRIELNNVVYVVDKNNISLNLQNGKNELIVKTNKDCQGVYKQTIDIDQDIFLSPNPFGDVINLSIPNNLLQNNISWELYSYQGKLIKRSSSKSIKSSTIEINMSAIATGPYIMKIITKDSIIHKKIIKE